MGEPLKQSNAKVALYCRVSSEDQAERGTVEAQRKFLQDYARLYSLHVSAEYIDDGISGVLPLDKRPEGSRLLQEASQGDWKTLLVYRLDRLGRSLTALLEAHTLLEAQGVTIKSATEPFDTASSIGRFLFQLLGSLAELERSTITERMTMGRDRVARTGKWTNGPIPFGYSLDPDGLLIPSEREAPGAGMTEAELAKSVFVRVAEGSSTIAEARRLNALGVPTHRRYASGTTVTVGRDWLPSRINAMLKNPVYAGTHVLNSRHGPVTRAVPPLVDQATWERAQKMLLRNRAMSTARPKTATTAAWCAL